MSPLFVVMLFLAFINLATSGGITWAVFPIAAMMIPVLITGFQIFLAEDKPDASQKRADAESQRPSSQRSNLRGEHASKLAQAQAYKRQIETMANAETNPLKKERLQELTTQVTEWTDDVEEMARQIDAFNRNEVIQRDLKTVPDAVKNLTAQLAAETDERVKATIERTLAARSDQLGSLKRLQSLMRQSEVQMESTIATLGTIYSQALAVQSTNDVAQYTHLSDEVNEQSKMLRDQLEALQEVKLDRTANNLAQQ
jgi:uncharacterized protein (DUF342 family)